MSAFLLYNIKLICCLALFYVGYKYLLSNETFFHFNRKILLTGMLVCALLPLVQIKTETPGIVQQPMIQLEKIITEEWAFSTNTFIVNEPTETTAIPAGKRLPPISFVHLLVLIFGTGSFVQLCLLIRSYLSLNLVIRHGRKIKQGNCTLVLLDKPVVPFNYGRFIILSESDYRTNPDTILTHEMAHLRLAHSFDIVLMELFLLIQWFNPAIRLLIQEVRKVHEFQADSAVLHTGIDATKYKLLLLKKAVDARSYTFVNSFNHNKLKTRFIMMTKKKSNSWARLKLLWLLPLAALSMYAFACTEATRQSEPETRSEDTTISSDYKKYSTEFFKNELNKFINEQGGSESLSTTEKIALLDKKTNFVKLFVNANDEIILNSESLTTEQLSPELTARLVADYPNKKSVLISLQVDKQASAEISNKIIQIVGSIFAENEELLKRKKQPALFLVRIPSDYSMRFNYSFTKKETESYKMSFSFLDDANREVRTFTFDNVSKFNDLLLPDHANVVSELKEWVKNLHSEMSTLNSVSIRWPGSLNPLTSDDMKDFFNAIFETCF